MSRGNILLIDDEEKFRRLMKRILISEEFIVFDVESLKAAFILLEEREVDVILCDVKLPDGNGLHFIEKVKKRFPLIEIIMLTCYGTISDNVQAIKNGAFDYLTKGDDIDQIIPLLDRATEQVAVQKG